MSRTKIIIKALETIILAPVLIFILRSLEGQMVLSIIVVFVCICAVDLFGDWIGGKFIHSKDK